MSATVTRTAVTKLRSEACRPSISRRQRQLDGDAVEDRAEHAADQRNQDAARAEQRLADDDGGKADDDGADTRK